MERHEDLPYEIRARLEIILRTLEAMGLPCPRQIIIPPDIVIDIEQVVGADTQIDSVLREAIEAADREKP